jgi:hypothetical protein
MFKRALYSVLFLAPSAVSAAVVVGGDFHALSNQDQEKVYRVLIKRDHDIERIDDIKTDLATTLPGKKLEPYFVADTLYQSAQALFDVKGVSNKQGKGMSLHVRSIPNLWKKFNKLAPAAKNSPLKSSRFKDYSYPTTLEDHKAHTPSVVKDWARFNKVIHTFLGKANFKTLGSQFAFSRILALGPSYQERHETRKYCFLVSSTQKPGETLKANEAFLRHAIRVEEEAHKDGKLILWRYAQPLAGGIPDSVFKIQGNDLNTTLASPLQTYIPTGKRISYASRLLEGFSGDGLIQGTPYYRGMAPACTFSFIANDALAKRNGYKIKSPIVYSLALTPGEITQLKTKLQLYYPREAMPQHLGIYGSGEGFHPSWMLSYKNKASAESWLKLMSSKALRVHLINGKIQDNYQNNAEAIRLRSIYAQFLAKARKPADMTSAAKKAAAKKIALAKAAAAKKAALVKAAAKKAALKKAALAKAKAKKLVAARKKLAAKRKQRP